MLQMSIVLALDKASSPPKKKFGFVIDHFFVDDENEDSEAIKSLGISKNWPR